MNRRQRRKLTAHWEAVFNSWREASAKYGAGDAFNTVRTFELFEDMDGDKSADVVIACDILEHVLDVDAALSKMKGLAGKAVAFFIRPDEIRTEGYWHRTISKHFVIRPSADGGDITHLVGGHIFIVAACINTFGADKIVAAGTLEGRWENVYSNMQAIPARVRPAPAHDRRAIIACYGPSLRHNLPPLREQVGDIVSVSGSHDFLLKNGIVPTYHVECDPRPHKADNIASGVHGVKYLLGATVHPSLTKKLDGLDLALWFPSGEFNFKIIDTYEQDATFVAGHMNVGLTSLSLFYQMGYRRFSIFGMDCSFEGEDKWAGPHAKKADQQEYKLVQVDCGGRRFVSSNIYIAYANGFFDLRKVLPNADFDLYGDSLLTAWVEMSKLSEAA